MPFAEDLQPAITSELDRKVYLMMSEENIADKLPGWLLSTGTLRILALLAVLRHPTPSPVIIIEEIENGLDPRTIHLLVDEIRYFVESGRGQVIVTTHSPYLLDLLNRPSFLLWKEILPVRLYLRAPRLKNYLKNGLKSSHRASCTPWES